MKTYDERMDDARAVLATEFCGNCREYKGMTEDEDGQTYCIFCE